MYDTMTLQDKEELKEYMKLPRYVRRRLEKQEWEKLEKEQKQKTKFTLFLFKCFS